MLNGKLLDTFNLLNDIEYQKQVPIGERLLKFAEINKQASLGGITLDAGEQETAEILAAAKKHLIDNGYEDEEHLKSYKQVTVLAFDRYGETWVPALRITSNVSYYYDLLLLEISPAAKFRTIGSGIGRYANNSTHWGTPDL